MKYEILYTRDPGILSDQIDMHLAEGWELYGSPFAFGDYVCQAIIKKDESDMLGHTEPSD